MLKKSILLFGILSSVIFASTLKVEDAYVRATPPNLPNSAAFMEITNTSSQDVALVSAKSNASNIVELHTHDMKDGVMKMYQVPKIDIKPNSTTVLKPGGFHVMLIDLKNKPLKEGMKIDVQLTFSNGETIDIKAPVKKVMAGMMMKNHGMKH
ncbi:MAG: copper chaperone PCu(A)C [Campylobacterota bacterium]